MGADDGPVDVLRYETDDGPVYRAIEAGEGDAVVAAHEREFRKRRQLRRVLLGVVALVCVGYGALTESLLIGLLGGAVVVAALFLMEDEREELVPTVVERNQFRRDAEREYDLEDG